MTQAEVARLTGCGPNGVSKFLRDRRGESCAELMAFCDRVRLAEKPRAARKAALVGPATFTASFIVMRFACAESLH